MKNDKIITAHVLGYGKPIAECWGTRVVLGTLSSIALNGGEGRGEEALIKMCEQNQRQPIPLAH